MAGGAFLRDRSLFRPTRQDHELWLQTAQQEDSMDRKAFAFQMIQPHFEFRKAVGLIDDPSAGGRSALVRFLDSSWTPFGWSPHDFG